MGLHVYVKFGTDAYFTEITSFVRYNSVKFDIKLMNDKFKSVQDSVKMQTIYDATLNARFFEAPTWMPAHITYDLQSEQMYGYDASSEYGYGSDAYGFLSVGNVFTGAIYPTTKDSYKSVPTEGVSFELVDNSYLLEVDCPAFTYTSSFKVFDPADTAHSVIHQLLYSAGLTDSDISSFNTISKDVGYLSYEAKDETIDKIIEDLLYEYHHVYYFNEDGQFCLYDWQHASITLADTIPDSVIKDNNGIERERNIYEYDGYLVTYKELLTKSNALVYREDVPAEGNLLIPTQTFPIDGEIKTIKQEYTGKWLSDDADILLTSNHVLELTADAGITKPVETYNNFDAQIVLKNTDIVDQRWYRLDIRADATYTDKENEFTLPTTAVLTEEVKLDHIYNDTDALDFANALYNNTVRYGLHTYGFKSETSFDVGLCYELEHYNVNVLLIGKKYNHYEHIFEYECLSVGAQVVETPDILYRLPSGVGSDAPSRYLALEADFNSIDVSARGAILVPTITFKARTIDIPIANITWSRSDAGSLGLVSGNDYLRTLDTSTVAGEFVTLTITASYGGTSYSATYTVKKVYQNPVPHNFEGMTVVPTDYDGEPLIAGDYFLWAGETDGTYTKGKIYIHTGMGWRTETSSDGNLVMTLFDDFSSLANDVDETVIGNAVIKKLVAIDAFIKNLKAQNLSAGNGDGTSGSGFRFRAMQDQYMTGGNNPVFDILYGDKVVFKVEPSTGKVYFGENFWYDPSDGGIHSLNDRIVIDSSGSLKATFAEIVGTVRTGIDAPTNTRFGARDRSGITVGPTFSGSGLNDLSIADEGNVDMLGIVKIESINHRDLSTTVPLTSASDWTIRTDTWDLSAKCFDSAINRIIGAGSGGIGYSDDSGTTWTRVDSTAVNWKDITVNSSSGIAVVVGYTGSGGTGAGRIAYSTNHGLTWTIIAPSGTYEFYSVAVNTSGRFVTSAKGAYNSDGIYYSDNGSSWNRASAYPLIYRANSIACNSNGVFVAVNDSYNGYSSGNSSVWYSSNGTSWSSVSIASYLYMSVSSSIYSTLFIITTNNINGTTKSQYFTSTNGSSWTYRQNSANIIYGYGFTFNPNTGYWIGSGNNTTTNYILYSSNGTSFSEYVISTVSGVRPVSDWSTGRFIVSKVASNYLAHTSVQPFYDKIMWSGNNGSSWTTGIIIPTNKLISLTGYGVSVSFGNRNGHTVNTQWVFKQEAMHGLVIWDVNGNEYLKASDGLLKVRDRLELGTPSLSGNGYTLLPNGLILQWGSVAGNDSPVTFPLAMTQLFHFSGTVWYAGSTVTAVTLLYNGAIINGAGKISGVNKLTTYSTASNMGYAAESSLYIAIGVL